jgi:hypothetical protein
MCCCIGATSELHRYSYHKHLYTDQNDGWNGWNGCGASEATRCELNFYPLPGPWIPASRPEHTVNTGTNPVIVKGLMIGCCK